MKRHDAQPFGAIEVLQVFHLARASGAVGADRPVLDRIQAMQPVWGWRAGRQV